MKNKYQIITNPPKLSDEQIAKHQDFDALLAQVQVKSPQIPRSPRSNRWLYYLGGAAAAALLGFFFYQSTLSSAVLLDQKYFAEKPFIDPPFQQIKAAYTQKSINANQGGVFEYENGSKIIVPPAAFVDDQGQLVAGKVDIRYREFHDYVDFFLSGIPMHYDSAGTNYQLESAGMVEIYAEQNGKKVNVAPGKKIDVELISEIMVPSTDRAKMPRFNVYNLDTEARNWSYQGVDQIEVLEAENPKGSPVSEQEKMTFLHQEALADLRQQELKAIEMVEVSLPALSAPVRPERASSDDVFDFDFNMDNINTPREGTDPTTQSLEDNIANSEQDIQRMRRQYEGTLWQVAPGSAGYDQKAADNVTWEDMKLRQLNNRDYELTLISGSTQLKMVVNPVLMGADYERAIQEFNQQFEVYQQQLAEREAQLAEQKTLLRNRYETLRQQAEQAYQDKIAALRAKGLQHEATDEMIVKKIVNRFQATTFGIWNCDFPIPPSVAQVKGAFKDDADNEFNSHTAFLVNQSSNTVCRFRARKGAPVNFNTDSDNLMWLITPENKLALFRPEKFRQINQKKGDYTFVMKVVDKEIQTEEDVRQILQF